jgi:hypothetical protein
MTQPIRIVVTGGDVVAQTLRKLGIRTSDLSDPMGIIGNRVVADARSLAPKKSGALAASVFLERDKTRATIGSPLVYAGPINYGWRRRNISPSLFLNRAADVKAEYAADVIAAEINQQIRGVGLG